MGNLLFPLDKITTAKIKADFFSDDAVYGCRPLSIFVSCPFCCDIPDDVASGQSGKIISHPEKWFCLLWREINFGGYLGETKLLLKFSGFSCCDFCNYSDFFKGFLEKFFEKKSIFPR